MTDDLEEPKNDIPAQDNGTPATDYPDEDGISTGPLSPQEEAELAREDDPTTSPEPPTEGDD